MEGTQGAPDFFFERVLTKISHVETPGYITSEFPMAEGATAMERLLFVPEDLLILIEKLTIEKYGEKGKRDLYGVGKQAGHNFISRIGIPKADPQHAMPMLARFLSTIYGGIEVLKADPNERIFQFDTKNLVLTARSNGGGYILTIGGTAGVWAYMLNDYTLECCTLKTGDLAFRMTTAPVSTLKQMGFNQVIEVPDINEYALEIDAQNYARYNEPPKHAVQNPLHVDLKKLLEAGILKYINGRMYLGSEQVPLLSIEVSLLYEIERFLDQQLVFKAAHDLAFQLGKALGQQRADWYLFLSQLLMGMGLGVAEPVVSGDKTLFNFVGYPWLSQACEKTSFMILKGLIAGFGEAVTGKQVKITDTFCAMNENAFVVSIEVTA